MQLISIEGKGLSRVVFTLFSLLYTVKFDLLTDNFNRLVA